MRPFLLRCTLSAFGTLRPSLPCSDRELVVENAGLESGVRAGLSALASARTAMQQRLRQHDVDALGAVDRLGHPQIGCKAAQRVGILLRQVGPLADQADHV